MPREPLFQCLVRAWVSVREIREGQVCQDRGGNRAAVPQGLETGSYPLAAPGSRQQKAAFGQICRSRSAPEDAAAFRFFSSRYLERFDGRCQGARVGPRSARDHGVRQTSQA